MHPNIPLEDFFRNSLQSAFQLSPDGRHLSYLAPWHDRMNLYVLPLAAALEESVPRGEPALERCQGQAVRLTSERERSVAGYMWAGDGRLLYMKDSQGDENYQLWGVDLDGGDTRAYTALPGVRTTLIDDLPEQPDQVLIGLNRRNPEVFDAYRLTLSTGQLEMVGENPGNIVGWMTDHEGRLRAATAVVDGVNTQLLYRDSEQEPLRPVLTTDFRETVSFMEFTPDGREVYAASNRGRDRVALVRLDPHTCQELEVLYEHPRYDLASILWSRRRRKLLGAYCTGHCQPVRHYFDEDERRLRERLQAFFPDRRYGVADTDRAEQRLLIYVGGDRTRGAYYYYDLAWGLDCPPRLLSRLAPWLPEQRLAPMLPFTYTARDGLLIEAYLSLPADTGTALPTAQRGHASCSMHDSRPDITPYALRSNHASCIMHHASCTRHPLVVIPHGGPWTRDCWGYSSEVQFLCSRGYAVLQMNFRGSTGYGRAFLEASFKQWGRHMQDDITDGVRHLIAEGVADPARVAIYGGSYGGYAALCGACFTPELYCCAVDYVGVSNLLTFMKTVPPYWRPMLEMMYQKVGHPEHDRELLAQRSPALHADLIRCPLLVAQGANDPRVAKAESDQMVQALRGRGVEVQYMVKDNEGHGFHNLENRYDFYRAMERFLARHMQPAATPSSQKDS